MQIVLGLENIASKQEKPKWRQQYQPNTETCLYLRNKVEDEMHNTVYH